MWTNYHTHCNYCDGKNSLEEIADAAIANKMPCLGFSSHAPLPFYRPWCMKPDQLDNYLREIKYLKTNQVEIYSGLEVDFIPDLISPLDFQGRLDYTIGSIHFVDTLSNGVHWEIDGTTEVFNKGFAEIFNGQGQALAYRYYELTQQMLVKGPPTIVGHLDKIKIHNSQYQLFNPGDTWYQRLIDQTLTLIKESGAIVEVNTRGLYQGKTIDAYPSDWILSRILQHRIPITLSSDAHHRNDLAQQFKETAIKLLGLGFKKIAILSEGTWKEVSFDENGIRI